MEERKFSGLSLTVIALLLVVLAGTGVYAYYASRITGTTSVRALEYDFDVNGTDTETNASFNITLSGDEIEPGVAVRVPVALSAEDSEVDVDYTIKVKYADDSTIIPGLVLCNGTVTANAAAGVTCPTDNTVQLGTTAGNVAKSGTLTRGTSAGTLDFYLVWPWGTADFENESEAKLAGETITFTLEVSGKQAVSYNDENRLPYPAGN